MPSPLTRFLPTTPLARSLSTQSILSASGDGFFLTGNAVFFTQVVGLSAAQVGLGLTLAGVVSFFFAIPLGRLTDRVGAKRVWGLTALAQAALYLLWPLAPGFTSFLALTIALELVVTASRSGRGAYTLSVFSGADRVRSLAFMRSARNIGYTLGALMGGLALATGSLSAIRTVPVLTAGILGVNALLVSRLPVLNHVEAPAARQGLFTASALRNHGFLAMTACDGVISTNQVLLNVVIPLWLVEQTDAPRVLLAWLFGTNTVLAVLLQVRASRGAETIPGALRASRISGAFFVLSCLIVLVTHDTVGWVTIALVWVGHVTVTGAELYQSAGQWGLVAELSDPARRGEYQGAAQLGWTAGSVWAPAVYTFLAINWGTPGWLLIGAIVVLATVGIHPATRAAERHLGRAEQLRSLHGHPPGGGLDRGWAEAVAATRAGAADCGAALVAGTAEELLDLGIQGGLDDQPGSQAGDQLKRRSQIDPLDERASNSAGILSVGDTRTDTGAGPSSSASRLSRRTDVRRHLHRGWDATLRSAVSETLKRVPDDINEVHDVESFEDAGRCQVTPVLRLEPPTALAVVDALAALVRRSHSSAAASAPDDEGITRAQVFEEGDVYMLAAPYPGFFADRYLMDFYDVDERDICSRMHLHTGLRFVRMMTGPDTRIRVSSLSPLDVVVVDGVTPFLLELFTDELPDAALPRTRYNLVVPENSWVDMQIPRGVSHQFNAIGPNAVIDSVHPEESIEALREKMAGLKMMAQTIFLAEERPAAETCNTLPSDQQA